MKGLWVIPWSFRTVRLSKVSRLETFLFGRSVFRKEGLTVSPSLDLKSFRLIEHQDLLNSSENQTIQKRIPFLRGLHTTIRGQVTLKTRTEQWDSYFGVQILV